MSDSKTLDAATQRAMDMGLDYAGAVTPDEAFKVMQENPDAKVVDVRTTAEWAYVGCVPDAVRIEWQIFPDMQVNERFLEELEKQVSKDIPVMFLCRSGVRSHHAASVASKAGWTQAYNVLEGFEGDLDDKSQRGAVNGWKFRGLPWKQG